MPSAAHIVGLMMMIAFFAINSVSAMAQSSLPEYDLESLGEEIDEPGPSEVCRQFTPELQKLAGCGEETGKPETEDNLTLEAVEGDGIGEPDQGNMPFEPIDPTQDMLNGLPAGGSGGADPFGQAIDDLTGGLF